MSLTITIIPMGASASDTTETFISENAEEATYALWDEQWYRFDANHDNLTTDSDFWCRTMHEVHGGTHAVYCAKIGYNSHYTRSGTQCLDTNITANTSTDQSNWVMRYDTEQDSIMRKVLDSNVKYYGTLTITFWFYSDTGHSNAAQPGSGTPVGYDFLNAIYYTGTQEAGNLTKHVLWTDTYQQAIAKSWTQVSLTLPSEATMVGFEFVSGTTAPEGGDASDAFTSEGITVVNGGMKEGVFLDDISVVGSDPLPTLPLASEVSDLPTYSGRSFPVSYTDNDPQVGLKWITLWYRVDETGSWTKYTTSLRPDGKFVSSPIDFVAPSDGKYEFYTRATDQLDVVEDAPSAADAWTIVDGVAPSSSISVNGTQSGSSYTGHVTINLTATDAISGLGALTYRLNGGSWTTYTGNVTVPTTGQYTVEYYATDLAGNNESVKSEVFTLTGGSTPVVEFSNSGKTYPDGNVTVDFDPFFEASTITKLEYSLDGGSYTTIDAAATSVTFTGLSNGTHHLTVRATDSSGQTATGSTSFHVAYATENDVLGDLLGNPLVLVGIIAAAIVAVAGVMVIFKRKK